ncbi:hypothetical protein F4860DRAFT_511667 [Xylaria cubensis]|nr:hypothetical protein F4860DRAFT_511667 [Xylaria cubensis]
MASEIRQCGQEVSLDTLRGEKQIRVYETDTGVCKMYQMKDLEKSNPSSSMLKVPVQKWRMRADVILHGDHERGLGPVQIASVPIPFLMAVQRSILGQEKSIYVTSRV